MNILLVIDMQKDFVDQALGTPEARAIVPNVVAKINEYKARGDVIIATKDTHEEPILKRRRASTSRLSTACRTPRAGSWMMRCRPLCRKTPRSSISPPSAQPNL